MITVMFGTLRRVLVSFFFNVTLCFTDEGRNAVDHAGGAHIVVDHIRSLCSKTDPASEKLLTVFCGMLMNYSNENGKQHQKFALCLPGEQPHQTRKKIKVIVNCSFTLWILTLSYSEKMKYLNSHVQFSVSVKLCSQKS